MRLSFSHAHSSHRGHVMYVCAILCDTCDTEGVMDGSRLAIYQTLSSYNISVPLIYLCVARRRYCILYCMLSIYRYRHPSVFILGVACGSMHSISPIISDICFLMLLLFPVIFLVFLPCFCLRAALVGAL